MITPRSTCCKECVDILPLIEEIDCRLYELSLRAYNNIVFSLNSPINQEAVLDLLNYKRILTYKYINSNYASHFTETDIASKIKKYVVGCRANCNCNKTPAVGFIPPIPLTTTSTSSTTSTTTSTSSTTTTTTTAVPTNFSFDNTDWAFIGLTDETSFTNYLIGQGFTDIVITDFSIVNNGTLQCNLSFTGISLDMNNFGITKINNTNSLVNLNTLYLAHNSLTTIENINSLTNLNYLDISFNSLTSLTGIPSLPNLQILLANNNLLTGADVGGTCPIIYIDLSNNQINNYNDLQSLPTLTNLNLTNNQITAISGVFSLLTNLATLNLSGNQITDFVNLNPLVQLATLFLSNNLGSFIDVNGFDNLTNLINLHIDNNQLTSLSFERLSTWADNVVTGGYITALNNIDDFSSSSTAVTLAGKGWTIQT